MGNVKFSEEWDKLKPENIVVDREFTTARAYDARKAMYYLNQLGKEQSILLNDNSLGSAVLLYIEYKWANDLPIEFWQKDMHSSITPEYVKRKFREFYGNENPFLIVLHLRWVAI